MNSKSKIEVLIGKGFFAVRVGVKYFGIVPESFNAKPAYVPVRVKSFPGKTR